MTSLGDRLHSLRKSKSLTQEAFASSLNERYDLKINKSMVSKWENNIDTPSLNSVKYMAIFFDVSLDYLLGISDCNQDFPVLASTPADPLHLTEQEEHLVVSFRCLNEEGREKVVEYVVDLAGMEKYQSDIGEAYLNAVRIAEARKEREKEDVCAPAKHTI